MHATDSRPAAAQLLSLLATLSFRLGSFQLSSGGTSDYYIDCRTTTLHAEGGRLTGLAILEALRHHGLLTGPSALQAVGGLTLGADPIVSNVATASAQAALEATTLATARLALAPLAAAAQGHAAPTPLLHGFLVRKAEKTHGTGRRIEGFCQPGANVLIVDDVCTTGASTITAIHAAREAGMRVAAVVCLVERQEANGRPAVESAAESAPFLALFTAKDIRAEHLRLNPQK